MATTCDNNPNIKTVAAKNKCLETEKLKKNIEKAEALRKQREADNLKKQQEEAQDAQKPQQEPQKPSDNTSTEQDTKPSSSAKSDSDSENSDSSSPEDAPEPLNQPITPLLMCDFACKKAIVLGIDTILGVGLSYYGYNSGAPSYTTLGVGLGAIGSATEIMLGSQYQTPEAFNEHTYVSSTLTSVFINTALLGLAAYGTGTLSAISTSIAVVAIPVATAIALKAYSSKNEDINSMSEMFKEASIIHAESVVDAGTAVVSGITGGIYCGGAFVFNAGVDIVSKVAGGVYSLGASLGNAVLYAGNALHESFYDTPEIH